eukprot:3687963-Rhodomonas_salina.4
MLVGLGVPAWQGLLDEEGRQAAAAAGHATKRPAQSSRVAQGPSSREEAAVLAISCHLLRLKQQPSSSSHNSIFFPAHSGPGVANGAESCGLCSVSASELWG